MKDIIKILDIIILLVLTVSVLPYMIIYGAYKYSKKHLVEMLESLNWIIKDKFTFIGKD